MSSKKRKEKIKKPLWRAIVCNARMPAKLRAYAITARLLRVGIIHYKKKQQQ